jgi:hypothetical protein
MSIREKVLATKYSLARAGALHAWSTLPLSKDEAFELLNDVSVFGRACSLHPEVAGKAYEFDANRDWANEAGDPWIALLGARVYGMRLVPIEGESLSLEAA